MKYNITDIINGYAQGAFLMDENGKLGWYTSRERAVIPLDERFRYPKSLQRVINQNRFSTAINRDFRGVVEGCANRQETWISPELKEIYLELYDRGYAYSFETWAGVRLAGGILGLQIGGAFIGESMFFNIPEGSKVAMVKLVEHLRNQGFILFDAQMQNPHLERFGACIISDREYSKLLAAAVKLDRHIKP
jgi:leucyl/phenylalanyl-tRNA--protein transferase